MSNATVQPQDTEFTVEEYLKLPKDVFNKIYNRVGSKGTPLGDFVPIKKTVHLGTDNDRLNVLLIHAMEAGLDYHQHQQVIQAISKEFDISEMSLQCVHRNLLGENIPESEVWANCNIVAPKREKKSEPSSKPTNEIIEEVFTDVMEGKVEFPSNVIKGKFGGDEKENTPSISPTETGEYRENLEALTESKQKLKDLDAARFDDESKYDEIFWLGEKSVWRSLIGRDRIWATLENRYPFALGYLMAHLAAISPSNVELMVPGTDDGQTPSIWFFGSGESGVGKGAVNKKIKQFVDAMRNINGKRTYDVKEQQKKLKDALKPAKDGEPSKPPVTFNLALINRMPTMFAGDATIAGISSTAAAHEEWAEFSENRIIPCGITINLPEGSQVFDMFNLLERKGNSAATLSGWWNNEIVDRVRQADSEFTPIKNIVFNMALTMTDSQLQQLIQFEMPQRGKSQVVSGFSARPITIAVRENLKNSKPEPITTEKAKAEKHNLNRIQDSLSTYLPQVQQVLFNQKTVWWNADLAEKYPEIISQIDKQKLIEENPESTTWRAFARKQEANFIRCCYGFALLRVVDEAIHFTKHPELIEITEIDANRAMRLIQLSIADRRFQEFQVNQQNEKIELDRESGRSLKQNSDRWYQIFTNPQSLSAWIEEKKSEGCVKPADFNRKISGDARKRLKEKYNINVNEEIKKFLEA
ncbi:DUF3987 domain-containing protein [Leptolyngbya sp. AN03gr2]|uniref:DUF3987 domain-containing protein n=1 Tax=unclassified Leptolyngbya TaxID=2650499 RepID=UPI003D31DF9E